MLWDFVRRKWQINCSRDPKPKKVCSKFWYKRKQLRFRLYTRTMKTNREMTEERNYGLIQFHVYFSSFKYCIKLALVWLNMKSQIVLENMSENVSNVLTRAHTWWIELHVQCSLLHVFSYIFNVLSFSTFHEWGKCEAHRVISKCVDHAMAEWDRVKNCVCVWMSEQANKPNERVSEWVYVYLKSMFFNRNASIVWSQLNDLIGIIESVYTHTPNEYI